MATYVNRSPQTASRRLGDEMIVMSTIDSTLFTLNPVGAVIWQAADGKTPLAVIVEEKVSAQFDVSAEQARTDTEEFVARLVEHGIMNLSDHPVTEE